jgi:3-oxoacyl-[acyl-carrier protein] reductase
MYNFNNKTVLITGASRGIGAEIARQFSLAGATVYVNYFISDYEMDAKENAEKIKNDIESKDGKCILIEGDVSSENSVSEMFDKFRTGQDKLDILINNAGYVVDKEFNKRELQDFKRTLNTNLVGPYLMSKKFFELMGADSKIVNIVSTNGINCTYPQSVDYDASKAGLISLTKNLATEFSKKGINVNAVAPGWVATDMNKQLPEDFIQEEAGKILMKRFAAPEEIAKPVLFLCSDDARYITASVLVVDGGMKLL